MLLYDIFNRTIFLSYFYTQRYKLYIFCGCDLLLQLHDAEDERDILRNEISEAKEKAINKHFEHAKAKSYVSELSYDL